MSCVHVYKRFSPKKCLQKVDLQMDIFYFLDQLDFATVDIFYTEFVITYYSNCKIFIEFLKIFWYL